MTMLLRDPAEQLNATREEFVIIRVVLARSAELVHGEVVNANGQVRGRFRRWTELESVVRSALLSP
jgi:hypothetical protein